MPRRMKRKPWHAKARQLWDRGQGLSTAEIGAVLGLHRNTVLRLVNPEVRKRDLARKAGEHSPRELPTPTKSRKPTEPWHHEAKALFAELGARYAEIGRRLGKSRNAVRIFLDYDAHVRNIERQKAKYLANESYREACKARALRQHRKRAAQQGSQPTAP